MIQEIAPHGGTLVNRLLKGKERTEALERAKSLKKVVIGAREITDLEMIAIGGFSPLEGFMTRDDFRDVVDKRHLANGLAWTIPVTLAVSKETAGGLEVGKDVALTTEEGTVLAILELSEKYPHERQKEAVGVYGTDDVKHPGVDAVMASPEVLLGGRICVTNRPAHNDFKDYRLDPVQTRELFKKNGWRRIVGFQTRNPIHRAHEYIQKSALEICDGLLLHPLVGQTKAGDISAAVRMQSYEIMFEHYYPKDRVAMTVLPASMRYAGPREAIFHALIRKNYGCTHFIVGRDHAGVGKYYGSFDAHKIFDDFSPEEIGITPLFFDYTFFCKQCDGMASKKTCPHDAAHHVHLSGTQVRELLSKGESPPSEFTRPEIARVLIKGLAEQSENVSS